MTTDQETRNFLDNHQYTEAAIEDYQLIFGQTFVSVGGRETTIEFLEKLNLQKNELVLDLGSGLGGNSFTMADIYGVNVIGIDTCTNMVTKANEFLQKQHLSNIVKFQLADATTVDFSAESFDAIFCREVVTHIEDKLNLFRKFYEWLKPGGRVLVNDQWRADKKEFSETFEEYVITRKYFMLPGKEQGKLLENAGFHDVTVQDLTAEYETILSNDIKNLMEKIELSKNDPPMEAKYRQLLFGWRQKLARSEEGSQRWGILTAIKN